MPEVFNEQARLFVECLANRRRSRRILLEEPTRVARRHPGSLRFTLVFDRIFDLSRWSELTSSFCVLNGPKERPAAKSAKLSAIPRSTTDFGVKGILPPSTLASSKSPTSTPTA